MVQRAKRMCIHKLNMIKRPSIFFFIFFVLLLLCHMIHIIKLDSKRSKLLSSNAVKMPHVSLVDISRSVRNITLKQNRNRSVENITLKQNRKKELVIDNIVLFTDFVLVIVVATNGKVTHLHNVAENRIDCVYKHKISTTVHPILSVDYQYDAGEPRWVVRCPSPPANHTATVGLRLHQRKVTRLNSLVDLTENLQTVKSWDSRLVYEAAFDGDNTIAVFTKNLHLNGEMVSNPSPFSCRFGKEIAVITKAITAAQEVIRCPLPRGVTKSSIAKSNEIIHVTIESTTPSKARRGKFKSYVLPSIAKLHKNGYYKQGNYEKFELCSCTMVWNQASFLKEWVIYHAFVGIQRWFVYDNNSDDGLKEVINDLNSRNYNVTRHVWPWVKSQEAGFAHCVLRARDQCKWVAFIDVDEFYYLPSWMSRKKRGINRSGRDSLRSVVMNVSTSSPSIGQIRTKCYEFGPSKLKKRPVKGVTLGYTCRLRQFNRQKSIVRPNAVHGSLLNRIHYFELKEGFFDMSLPHKKAVINHYRYQVWDTFKAKFVRRVSAYVPDWQDSVDETSNDRTPGLGTQAIEPRNWHTKFCEAWDTRLRKFIVANLADSNTKLLPWQRGYSRLN